MDEVNKQKKERKHPMDARKIRFSQEDQARIQMLADLYAGGNFSKWVRWAALNAPRKILN